MKLLYDQGYIIIIVIIFFFFIANYEYYRTDIELMKQKLNYLAVVAPSIHLLDLFDNYEFFIRILKKI